MSKDRQIEALSRRNKKDREDHARAMAAKNAELRALRESWELFDTFPALENFLGWLHKIRDAGGPLRSPTFQTGHSADTLTQSERGMYPDSDRARITGVNRQLDYWAKDLEARLSPRGPLVDDEIPDVSKPTCHNPQCPARLIPQSFDREICYECKIAFTEFRPGALRRCWTRNCHWYGKSGRCAHAWHPIGESG